MAAVRRRVYLHVGVPKTGTTHIQEMLWHNRAALAAQGLLYPGYVHHAHFNAAVDLQRERYETWVDPAADGAWDRLVAHVRQWPGRSVITSELLATANRSQVERVLRSLDFAEVHVICTVRDLARQIPSMWQENVRNRHTESYGEFLAAIRRPEPSPLGDLFWQFQDLGQILKTWSRDLPPERVHVLTVPGRGAPPDELWQRFAGLVGTDSGSCEPWTERDNHSLGSAQTEVLRRINLALPAFMGWPQYREIVKEYLTRNILAAQGDRPRITLPAEELAWVGDRAELFKTQIETAGYDVVGDLAELVPRTAPGPIGEPRDRELLDAAINALAELVSRLPTNPDHGRPGERVKQALRTFSEQHPPVMALREWYWRGKAKVSWTRGASR
jgi:hypothetical protein